MRSPVCAAQIPVSGHVLIYYNMIRDWVLRCYDDHCFCPDNKDSRFDASSNIAAYISSPGTELGGVSEARNVR